MILMWKDQCITQNSEVNFSGWIELESFGLKFDMVVSRVYLTMPNFLLSYFVQINSNIFWWVRKNPPETDLMTKTRGLRDLKNIKIACDDKCSCKQCRFLCLAVYYVVNQTIVLQQWNYPRVVISLRALTHKRARWFKHILFMMKRIGRGLNATRALSWKEYLQGNSLTHTVIQQHEHTIKIHNIKTCD